MKHLLLFGFLIYSHTSALALDQVRVDSLNTALTKEKTDTGRARILITISVEYWYSNTDTVMILAMKAEGLCNDFIENNGGDENSISLRAEGIIAQGHSHFRAGHPEEALPLYEKALGIFRDIKSKAGIAKAYSALGSVYRRQGEYDEALEYHLKAVKLYESLGDRGSLARSFGNIGIVYDDKGEYSKALDYYFKGLRIQDELKDYKGVALSNGNIGNIYMYDEDYAKALEYYQKSFDQKQKLGLKSEQAATLSNMGLAYWNIGDGSANDSTREANYDISLDYYLRALEIDSSIKNDRGIAIRLGNIAIIYTRRNDIEKAISYYKASILANGKIGRQSGVALNTSNMGELYSMQKQYVQAEKYMLEGLTLAEDIGYLALMKMNAGNLSELYELTGRYAKSLKYYKSYTEMKDSLFNEQKSKEIGKLEAIHEFETMELENKRTLEEQSKKEAATKLRRDNLQYSAILIFLVIVFAGIFAIGKLSIPLRIAEGIIFFAFLLFFEFVLVLLDPYIENFSSGEPAYKLLSNALLAGLIFPLHSFFERRMKMRMVSK